MTLRTSVREMHEMVSVARCCVPGATFNKEEPRTEMYKGRITNTVERKLMNNAFVNHAFDKMLSVKQHATDYMFLL